MPQEILAEASIALEEAKDLCSNDYSCAKFYRYGEFGKYFKCTTKSVVMNSSSGSTLYQYNSNRHAAKNQFLLP